MAQSSQQQNPMVDFHLRYRHNPVAFVREVLQAKPLPWQCELLEAVICDRRRRISVRSGHGTGKYLINSDFLVTPTGWIRNGDISTGDVLFDMDGRPTQVTAVYPQGKQPLYRVTFSDGSSCTAGLPHRWVARQAWEKHHGRDYREVTTQEMLDSVDRNWQIPVVAPVRFPEADLPLDPYLVGYVLANGNLCTSGAVRVSCFDAGPYERIAEGLPQGYSLRGSDKNYRHISTGNYGCQRNVVYERFDDMGLAGKRSNEKFIPALYLRGSVEQRIALLQGLMDADGCMNQKAGRPNNYRALYYTTSPRLRDNVIELVQSLGGIASYNTDTRRRDIRTRTGRGKGGHDTYQITVNLPDVVNPFSVERKASMYEAWVATGTKRPPIRTVRAIEYACDEEATCISVDSPTKTYLTNDFIVTHNTTAMAWAMLHTITFNLSTKVICTAPAAGTLFDGLMAEVKKWITKAPEWLQEIYDVTGDHIRIVGLATESFISARTSSTDKPEALAGIHAERVLLVVDEASGVPEAVYQAAQGSMSTANATTVLIGNPTRNSGYFFDTHHVMADHWWRMHVSCVGNANVDPDFIEQYRRQYGEDSNEFRVRVLGEFPLDDGSSYIARPLVMAAMARHMEVPEAMEEVWGLDVARTGGDRVALARRKGPVVSEVQAWAGKDLMQTVGVVKSLWDATPTTQRPVEILVDAIGMGAGVVDRLVELGLPAVAVNVSESSGILGVGTKLRDELWYRMRMALSESGLVLPYDEELATELSTPMGDYQSNGKLKMESKKDMRKRGFKSPDKADAVNLTLATNTSPWDTVSTAGGARNARSYNPRGPLRRNLNATC